MDASVALSWCYPDEHSVYALRVLLALEQTSILVPAHWRLELSNAVLTGERKRRLEEGDVARFFSLLDGLEIATDPHTSARALGATLALARAHRLTSYDAAYLELAMRENLPLATADAALLAAAKAASVRIFQL